LLRARKKAAWQWSLTTQPGLSHNVRTRGETRMRHQADDNAGPTAERIGQAGEFFTLVGRAKSNRHFTMLDDALGRAWVRHFISAAEYSALKKYALHWLAGGLQGHLGSVDLNRILAFDPGSMTGLCKTEAQADHRNLYYAAREEIGTRPAWVADHVACFDTSIRRVAEALGYRSPYRGREKVREILSDAGYRLGKFWDDRARGN
jgi:hypothetical protein